MKRGPFQLTLLSTVLVKKAYLKCHNLALAMPKKPWLSAILNFFFFGIGYVYNGSRVGFGIGLFVVWLLLSLSSLLQLGSLASAGVLSEFGQLVLSIVLAYDGYKEAQVINKRGKIKK